MILRRRRTFILKICVAAVLCWLGFILFASRSEELQENKSDWVRSNNDNEKQPVIERPDPDRLRFQERMKIDAQNAAERRRIQEAEKKRIEDERIRRIQDRVVPPFRDVVSSKVVKTSQDNFTPKLISNLDPRYEDLIRQGLVVPKWHLDKEEPAVVNGTGDFYYTRFIVLKTRYYNK